MMKKIFSVLSLFCFSEIAGNNKVTENFIGKNLIAKTKYQNNIGFALGSHYYCGKLNFVYFGKKKYGKLSHGFALFFGGLLIYDEKNLLPNALIAYMLGANWKKFSLDFVIGLGLGVLFTFNTHPNFNVSIFIGYEIIELYVFIKFPYDIEKFYCAINIHLIFSWKIPAIKS